MPVKEIEININRKGVIKIAFILAFALLFLSPFFSDLSSIISYTTDNIFNKLSKATQTSQTFQLSSMVIAQHPGGHECEHKGKIYYCPSWEKCCYGECCPPDKYIEVIEEGTVFPILKLVEKWRCCRGICYNVLERRCCTRVVETDPVVGAYKIEPFFCSIEDKCCGDGCCPEDQICCDGICFSETEEEMKCCGYPFPYAFACPLDYECCGGQCCPPDQSCVRYVDLEGKIQHICLDDRYECCRDKCYRANSQQCCRPSKNTLVDIRKEVYPTDLPITFIQRLQGANKDVYNECIPGSTKGYGEFCQMWQGASFTTDCDRRCCGDGSCPGDQNCCEYPIRDSETQEIIGYNYFCCDGQCCGNQCISYDQKCCYGGYLAATAGIPDPPELLYVCDENKVCCGEPGNGFCAPVGGCCAEVETGQIGKKEKEEEEDEEDSEEDNKEEREYDKGERFLCEGVCCGNKCCQEHCCKNLYWVESRASPYRAEKKRDYWCVGKNEKCCRYYTPHPDDKFINDSLWGRVWVHYGEWIYFGCEGECCGDKCCPGDSTCCGDKCCPPGQECCSYKDSEGKTQYFCCDGICSGSDCLPKDHKKCSYTKDGITENFYCKGECCYDKCCAIGEKCKLIRGKSSWWWGQPGPVIDSFCCEGEICNNKCCPMGQKCWEEECYLLEDYKDCYLKDKNSVCKEDSVNVFIKRSFIEGVVNQGKGFILYDDSEEDKKLLASGLRVEVDEKTFKIEGAENIYFIETKLTGFSELQIRNRNLDIILKANKDIDFENISIVGASSIFAKAANQITVKTYKHSSSSVVSPFKFNESQVFFVRYNAVFDARMLTLPKIISGQGNIKLSGDYAAFYNRIRAYGFPSKIEIDSRGIVWGRDIMNMARKIPRGFGMLTIPKHNRAGGDILIKSQEAVYIFGNITTAAYGAEAGNLTIDAPDIYVRGYIFLFSRAYAYSIPGAFVQEGMIDYGVLALSPPFFYIFPEYWGEEECRYGVNPSGSDGQVFFDGRHRNMCFSEYFVGDIDTINTIRKNLGSFGKGGKNGKIEIKHQDGYANNLIIGEGIIADALFPQDIKIKTENIIFINEQIDVRSRGCPDGEIKTIRGLPYYLQQFYHYWYSYWPPVSSSLLRFREVNYCQVPAAGSVILEAPNAVVTGPIDVSSEGLGDYYVTSILGDAGKAKLVSENGYVFVRHEADKGTSFFIKSNGFHKKDEYAVEIFAKKGIWVPDISATNISMSPKIFGIQKDERGGNVKLVSIEGDILLGGKNEFIDTRGIGDGGNVVIETERNLIIKGYNYNIVTNGASYIRPKIGGVDAGESLIREVGGWYCGGESSGMSYAYSGVSDPTYASCGYKGTDAGNVPGTELYLFGDGKKGGDAGNITISVDGFVNPQIESPAIPPTRFYISALGGNGGLGGFGGRDALKIWTDCGAPGRGGDGGDKGDIFIKINRYCGPFDDAKILIGNPKKCLGDRYDDYALYYVSGKGGMGGSGGLRCSERGGDGIDGGEGRIIAPGGGFLIQDFPFEEWQGPRLIIQADHRGCYYEKIEDNNNSFNDLMDLLKIADVFFDTPKELKPLSLPEESAPSLYLYSFFDFSVLSTLIYDVLGAFKNLLFSFIANISNILNLSVSNSFNNPVNSDNSDNHIDDSDDFSDSNNSVNNDDFEFFPSYIRPSPLRYIGHTLNYGESRSLRFYGQHYLSSRVRLHECGLIIEQTPYSDLFPPFYTIDMNENIICCDIPGGDSYLCGKDSAKRLDKCCFGKCCVYPNECCPVGMVSEATGKTPEAYDCGGRCCSFKELGQDGKLTGDVGHFICAKNEKCCYDMCCASDEVCGECCLGECSPHRRNEKDIFWYACYKWPNEKVCCDVVGNAYVCEKKESCCYGVCCPTGTSCCMTGPDSWGCCPAKITPPVSGYKYDSYGLLGYIGYNNK